MINLLAGQVGGEDDGEEFGIVIICPGGQNHRSRGACHHGRSLGMGQESGTLVKGIGSFDIGENKNIRFPIDRAVQSLDSAVPG